MTRGLARLTAYANKLEALADWRRQVERAARHGTNGLEILGPHVFDPLKAGWRTIDKHMAALRAELDDYESDSRS